MICSCKLWVSEKKALISFTEKGFHLIKKMKSLSYFMLNQVFTPFLDDFNVILIGF